MSAPESPRLSVAPPSAVGASVEAVRARRFLIAQSALLAFTFVVVAVSIVSGTMSVRLIGQSALFVGLAAAMTVGGWTAFLKLRFTTGLVLALLYFDSVLALVFFYAAGEFETPALAITGLCVVMAPVYAGKNHAWGIASLQLVLYSGLVLARQYGWIEDILPYGYMIPRQFVTEPGFVTDSVAAYWIACLGMAFLAGEASIDIVNSQKQLEAEVAAKTADIARASDTLRLANQDLTRKNEWLNQFSTAVSHDLRAPLQVLTLRAELVQFAGKNPAAAENIDELCEGMVQTALRMGGLIDELLRLARVGDSPGQQEAVSVETLISMVRADLAEVLRLRDARLEVVHPLPVLWCNKNLLREVLQNLLENAIKYGGRVGPRVRLESVDAPPGRAAFAIEDDGLGVPEKDRLRIFDLFKRMDHHRDQEGVGAGLAIVQRVIEVHGGSVRVEDGRTLSGARFVVELSAIPPTTPPEPPAAPR
jgi:signal transduction histidine kinase